jgi:nicotinamidase-related amidase
MTMATVREGNQAALLVVDVQVGVMAECWDAPRVIGNVSRVVDKARAAAVPVLWVQHSDHNLARGSAPWQWVPDLAPGSSERVLDKHFNSSFEQTLLEEALAQLGASHIVLAGAMTNWCIRATAYGAIERGYDVTLVEDAHTTDTMVLDDGTKIEAGSVIHDLNIAMRWLSYPGRKNGVATAQALVFTPPPLRA